METIQDQRFCGRQFTAEEMSLIQEVVGTCSRISRMELAHTVCELLDWKRPGGGLKARECRDLLERLEGQGVLRLPEKKVPGITAPRKSRRPAPVTEPFTQLSGSVEAFAPLEVQLVETEAAATVPRAGEPVPLSGLRDALRGAAAVSGVREPSGARWSAVCSFPLRPGG